MTFTLINRSIVSFERDCRAVGDDSTDNAPAWQIAAGHMAWGMHVEAGPGRFRFSTAPAFTMQTGGFHGAGPGGSPFGGPCGTFLRHTGTGHGLSFAAAANMEWSGFALHPTQRKSGDSAEIFLGDRATNLKFRNLRLYYPNVGVRSEAGVHNKMEDCVIFAPAGASGWYATGIVGGNRNEGLTLIDCESYTPQKRLSMPEANTLKDYATTSTFAQSDFAFVSGWLMECYTAGSKGAAPPAIPAMTQPHEHTTTFIQDGTITWALVCKADYAAVDADSWGDFVTLERCRLLQGVHAVRMKNTRPGASAASRPKKMVINGMQNDHNAGHGCDIQECGSFLMSASEIESARGAAVAFGAGTAHRVVTGNRLPYCDGGTIIQTAPSPWGLNDYIFGNTPDDGTFARGALGEARMDTNYGVNSTLRRTIGGVTYQWHFGIKDNGDFEVRQDLPVGNVVQNWPHA